jgi:two-component system, chemotaxis family, sensor kinase CheA
LDRDKLIQRLRATFLLELREHVEAFNRELLTLERETNDATRRESIKTLFRTAHSLKGASRAVNASKLEAVCHKLEELLQALRDGTRPFTPEVFESLFAAVDTFEIAAKEFAASSPPPPDPGGGMGRFATPTGRTPAPASKTPAPAAPSPRANERAAASPPPEPPASSLQPKALPSDSQLEPASGSLAPSFAETATGQIPRLMTLPPIEGGVESEPPASAASREALVRVPERKLDSLLSCSGELLLARRRLDARTAELAQLHEHLAELRQSLAREERSFIAPAARGLAEVSFRVHGGAALNVTGKTMRPARARAQSQSGLQQLERAFDAFATRLSEDLRALDRSAQALDERVHEVRMVPFAEACAALYRTVRDLAARERKPTELVVEGGDTELDRSIVDGLRAPLLHLVRNAIDHGIESSDERSLAGKPARSRLLITAALRGELVEVTVRDDGRGIDLPAIRERLQRRGVEVPADDQELVRTIFDAGFSTAAVVTDVSGRGVGLDVVRSQVEGMRGAVGVTFEPGRGACFTLTLPLTVTTLRALLLRCGSEVLALPSSSVVKLVRAEPSQLSLVQGREMLLTEASPVPLVSLAELLGVEAQLPAAGNLRLPVVVLGLLGTKVAFAVDELIAEQDVVVKPLGRRVRRLRHVSGATILPNGRIALLLHPSDLLRSAQGRMPSRRAGAVFQVELRPARKRLLLVDDSATTRTLEKSILEAAGHDVIASADGATAWQLLQEGGADLVVSDVEMPGMNGFALTQTIRSSKRFRDLPVILLTSLDSEQDRARGLEAGANAYLVKSAFDQTNLLETIRQLL